MHFKTSQNLVFTLIIKSSIILILSVYLKSQSIFADPKENLKQKMLQLVENGAIVLNDENGKRLISYNAEKMLIPASIIKILTSYIAIDILGKDYSFKTEFFRDRHNNIAIKGWGDPYLISEEIAIITKALKDQGITNIKQIFLDNSSFAPNIIVPGVSKTLNPYDAINAALVVNFNTINIQKNSNGILSSAESVTPLTPLARRKGKVISSGSKQRISLTRKEDESLQYVGELFTMFFQNAGINIENKGIFKVTINESWDKFYTHHNSKKMTQLVKGLLKYSNNFIANQLYLSIAAERVGTPATLEKSTKFFTRYINLKLNTPLEEFALCEGSGISRQNKISGNIMIMVMEIFKKNSSYLSKKNGALIKSGTLTGVYNYAGYIKTNSGLKSFVIILNQKKNYRNNILQLLKQYCKL